MVTKQAQYKPSPNEGKVARLPSVHWFIAQSQPSSLDG